MDLEINKKYHSWTIISFSGRDNKSNKLYLCKCDCGFEKIHDINTLRRGLTQQCKTCRMNDHNKVENLIGKSFGSWSVISKEKNLNRNEWFYNCKCLCGTEKLIPGYHLKSNGTTQCHKCRNKTHAMSYTDTYKIWAGILRRCFNKNFKAYKYYGGRGITICDRWLRFENFLEDMGIRPENLQIDRINNDGNYEPGNCRWTTAKINTNNRRCSKVSSGS